MGALKIFKVKSGTPAVELGSAVAHALAKGDTVELRAIGPSAVNQAAKSVPIAQGYVAQRGMTVITTIKFCDATVAEGQVSALAFTVEGVGGWATEEQRNRVLTH
jgi:stage V sporulation protein SpoVS